MLTEPLPMSNSPSLPPSIPLPLPYAPLSLLISYSFLFSSVKCLVQLLFSVSFDSFSYLVL